MEGERKQREPLGNNCSFPSKRDREWYYLVAEEMEASR